MSDPSAHLLIVDDDERIRGLLQKFLVRHGFLTTAARDAAHARRLVEGLEFDLIVLDVMMPGEDGISLTKSLREEIMTPILLLTARGEASDRIGGLEAGQTVLVHGASGGVGLAACDLARAMGAKVIAATHREDKLDRLRAIAKPDAAILNTDRFRDLVGELTGGRLCDLVFDPVGGDVFDESTRCVTFGGKLLVVGFVAGRIPEIAVNIPLIKGFSVVGVRAGEYARRFPERGARIAEAIDQLASEGRITPYVERTLPLTSWREAFEAMARGGIIGKLVLEP